MPTEKMHIDWMERLRQAAAEEQLKTGCRIRLEIKSVPSGTAGSIFYHNKENWTVTVCSGFFYGRTASRHIWEYYVQAFIRAQVRMDSLCMKKQPESYLQGIAMLSHIRKREMEKRILLRPPRRFHKSLRRTCPMWEPDDLYCDLQALRETVTYARASEDRSGAQHAETKIWVQLYRETVLFSSMPEILYPGNKIPHRLVPFLWQGWESLYRNADRFAGSYPVLLRNEKAVEDAGRGTYEKAFYRYLSVRLLNDPEETALLELQQEICDYIAQGMEYICKTADTQSRLLQDNRIAVERTAAGLQRMQKKYDLSGPGGSIHSLGYY